MATETVQVVRVLALMVWFLGVGMVCFALFSVDARFRHLVVIGLGLMGIGLLLPVIGLLLPHGG